MIRTNSFLVEDDDPVLWSIADSCARLWNELNFERRQRYIHYKKFS